MALAQPAGRGQGAGRGRFLQRRLASLPGRVGVLPAWASARRCWTAPPGARNIGVRARRRASHANARARGKRRLPSACAASATGWRKTTPRRLRPTRKRWNCDRALAPESEDVAIGLNDLAEAERLSGDYAAAERDYREALRIARKINDREGVATYTGNLAELALDREQWAAGRVAGARGAGTGGKGGAARVDWQWIAGVLPKRWPARAARPRGCPMPAAPCKSLKSCARRIWKRRARC